MFNVKVKVLRVKQPGQSTHRDPVQNIVIANQTASAHLTLWGTYINKMELGKSYSLSQARLKEYLGDRFLCTTRDGTKIDLIANFDEVVTEEPAAAPPPPSAGKTLRS